MKRRGLACLLSLAVTGSIIGAAAIHSGATDLQADTTEASAVPVSTVELVSSTPDFSYANVADVAEAVMPSIVSITNTSVQEVRDWFSRRAVQYETSSAGSGIIVGSNDEELLICTNNHVVEGATELTVTFIDEESYQAVVKGTDPSNDLAIAAVKLSDIPDETMNAIRIAKIGSSDQMRVGEQVVAIGNALGYGQSVTTGIVSAKDRSIDVAESMETTTYENLIQTDAAINPGNSGGALLNMNGEVIGINSAKASSSGVEGMGYAIPVDKAMPILENLMNRQTRTRLEDGDYGYVGINGQSVSSEATMLYGIPAGVYVTYVGENTPAEKAGLKEGDIITAFDGLNVSSMEEFQDRLQYYAPGETVDMTVSSKSETPGRGYEEKTLTITLGDRSELQ